MSSVHQLALNQLYASLELDRKAIGVRFLFTKEEYDACPVPPAKAKMAYCVMVKVASSGICLKADLSLFGCGGATRALGLEEPSPTFCTGQEYLSFGLYQDLAVSKYTANHITLCSHHTHGVLLQPLEDFTEDCPPHIAILVTNSYNAMRVVQGYTYKYGTQTTFKIAGNQALCAECSAYPFESNHINVSLLCSGTRYLAGWKDSDIAIGMPYGQFLQMCDGLYLSANGAEDNKHKAAMRERLAARQLTDPGLVDGEGYFIRCRG